ncbi:MAG: ribose 5-phosphate isomerase B [Clostridia bacterium]|nr:ribose 5-phosphate isomerase B [Clostridia bacterium]
MIAIGSDHGGYELKEQLLQFLEENGYETEDCGTFSGESVDYPDIAEKVAKVVLAGDAERGILICGTGIGISIAANKINGIRAAHCTDPYSARMAREHNNANIIALGGRITGTELAIEILCAYLDAEFQGGRHQRRVDKITALETQN